eukprot:TRINITY_DN99069_c0_g1_i1.p1 TRINITY_DN99069_c0_g1~~TRINITY_DN99069_c0_g1_i1.p1  ORF type:complete len:306 (-),score=76.76 TRINITY_DN99069_c0_g1_i1:65-982(-)
MDRVQAEVSRITSGLLAPLPRVILLTGGSRGYGQGLAEAFAEEASSSGRSLSLALLARDGDGLAETEKAVNLVAAASSTRQNKLRSHSFVVDLAVPQKLEAVTSDVFEYLEDELSELVSGHASSTLLPKAEVVLVHNSGSLGRLAYIQDLQTDETAACMDLNVTGAVVLTQLFLRRFVKQAKLPDSSFRIIIVNISSLLALQAFPSWSLYATAKASRDMFVKAVAADAKAQGHDVRCLSWAPGPMHTSMVQEVLDSCPDVEVRNNFEAMQSEGKFVDVRESAARLVKLLCHGNFESGAHVDFFDV